MSRLPVSPLRQPITQGLVAPPGDLHPFARGTRIVPGRRLSRQLPVRLSAAPLNRLRRERHGHAPPLQGTDPPTGGPADVDNTT